MAINLYNLLARHYSTEGNGLTLEDSKTIHWEHDGFGHLTAHLIVDSSDGDKLNSTDEKETL